MILSVLRDSYTDKINVLRITVNISRFIINNIIHIIIITVIIKIVYQIFR